MKHTAFPIHLPVPRRLTRREKHISVLPFPASRRLKALCATPRQYKRLSPRKEPCRTGNILRRNRESSACTRGKFARKGLSHLPDPGSPQCLQLPACRNSAEPLGRYTRSVAEGTKPYRSFSKNAGTQTYRSMFQTLVIRIAMGIVNPEGEGRGDAQGRKGRPSVRARGGTPSPGERHQKKNDKIVY